MAKKKDVAKPVSAKQKADWVKKEKVYLGKADAFLASLGKGVLGFCIVMEKGGTGFGVTRGSDEFSLELILKWADVIKSTNKKNL
jgi:hypothetical protein